MAGAFECLAVDKIAMSGTQIVAFFKALILPILVVAKNGGPSTADELDRVATITAEDIVVQIMQFLGEHEAENNQISFEDIADWYTSGGYEGNQFLELLDTSKWPRDPGARPGEVTPNESS